MNCRLRVPELDGQFGEQGIRGAFRCRVKRWSLTQVSGQRLCPREGREALLRLGHTSWSLFLGFGAKPR